MDESTVGSLANRIRHAVLRSAIEVTQGRHYRRLIEGAKTPRDAQTALLCHILATNAETDFGKRHGFSQIKDVDAYRRAVQIQTYEDLWPFIEHQELTGERCLTWEQPVYYHRTSGTVGAPKNIPITTTGLMRIKRHQQISTYVQSRGSAIFEGRVFAISGQAIEGKMAGGTPCLVPHRDCSTKTNRRSCDQDASYHHSLPKLKITKPVTSPWRSTAFQNRP